MRTEPLTIVERAVIEQIRQRWNTVDREALGRHVRAVWVTWATEQPHQKSSWFLSWEELPEAHREVDRRIGLALQSQLRADVQTLLAAMASALASLAAVEEERDRHRELLKSVLPQFDAARSTVDQWRPVVAAAKRWEALQQQWTALESARAPEASINQAERATRQAEHELLEAIAALDTEKDGGHWRAAWGPAS